MASVVLTVQVKTQKPNTPDEEAQPKKSAGDEKIFSTMDMLKSARKALNSVFAMKAVSVATTLMNDQIQYYLSTTGDSYQQELYNTITIKNILKKINLYERYKWSRQTNYNLMWENRNAEQAARRSGNYLTGNSR